MHLATHYAAEDWYFNLRSSPVKSMVGYLGYMFTVLEAVFTADIE